MHMALEILGWLLLLPFCAAGTWLLYQAAVIGDEQRALQGMYARTPASAPRHRLTWLRASATPPRYR